MPELPEVEFARRNLRRWFRGRTLVRTEADPGARTFRGADARLFLKTKGRLVDAKRRGKYLLLSFSDGHGAVAHLGMTGKVVRRPQGEAVAHSRARWVLDSGDVIHFSDPRLFGRIEPCDAKALLATKAVAKLGVDPLEDGLPWKTLKARLGTSRQALKVALMDQSRVAGLGNIHAVEALFRARLHPARAPGSLTDAEWRVLARAILTSIRFALKDAGTGDDIEYVEEAGAPNPFFVYGRAGGPCPRCSTTVKSITQGGRTTHFCPACQPPGARTRSTT